MTMIIIAGVSAHVPTDPDYFHFDAEVASIFPSMAERSIPMYRQAHAHTADITCRLLGDRAYTGMSLMDVGASRGAFIAAMANVMGRAELFGGGNRIIAAEASEHMRDLLASDWPEAQRPLFDVTSPGVHHHAEMASEAHDVLALNYVLQFIHPSRQQRALLDLIATLKPGGVMVHSHKLAVDPKDELAVAIHDEYIEFRLRNGYTFEEIEAKTRALANSMWAIDENWLLRTLGSAGELLTENGRTGYAHAEYTTHRVTSCVGFSSYITLRKR